MALTTKQKFINATYEAIKEKGLENLTVRDIAKRVGHTPAALYKHFESMNYLSMLACMKYMEEYMEELIEITSTHTDPIEIDLLAWKTFTKHAFQNPPVFLHLFWGPHTELFEDAVAEYYQLFPLEKKSDTAEVFYGYLFTASYTGNLQERDFVWLRRGASEGLLDYDDAKYISMVNSYIVRGMLLDCYNDYQQPDVARKAAEKCDALVEKTINTFLKKNVDRLS